MVRKSISRKQFLNRALSGITGLSLIKSDLKILSDSVPEMRTLGKTEIKVTPLCFGAPRTNEESLIRYAIEKGINFIDTGRSYSNGNNERLVGRAVSGIRNSIVIQSKIRLEENELPSKGKGKKGAEEIRGALASKLDSSLKAMNTDYIDILLYHDAIDESLLFHNETMKFFLDMKKAGKIRAHGFSTHNDFMNLPERNNTEKFYDTIMIPFNHGGSFIHSVSGRHSEWDQNRLITILQDAHRSGIGIIAMKTCSGGKYSSSEGIEPCYQEAVKWVIRKEFITSAAIAMANFEQVNEHCALL